MNKHHQIIFSCDHVFISLCPGLARSTLNLNGERAPDVAKRSVDDGPQANAHIIEKRDDSDPAPTGLPGPFNRPPLGGGGNQPNAIQHRRSVDDFLGDDGMSIDRVIHKREDVEGDDSLTGGGAMPISHVIHKREEVEDLVDDDEGGMSLPHVIRKREEVEPEPIKLDTDSETTTPRVREPRNKRKTVKQDASLTGDGPAN